MPSEVTSALLKLDKEYVIHPMAAVGADPTTVIEEGHGIYVTDADGKTYIDGASQLTCMNLGYGKDEITEAVAEQMKKLPYTTSFGGNCSRANIECSKKLAELAPKGINHFYYTLGGSDSIDATFRIARTYWCHQGRVNKYKIISLYNAYHGVNMGAAPATTLMGGTLTSGIHPLVPGFIHVPSYYCYRCALGLNYPDCGIQCAKLLAYTIANEGKDTIAAVIAEPVHGTAGSIVPPSEWWPMVRKICSDNDVLLIADEVMTGFGRTGKMFATEHWDVVPDMMAMAKGLTSSYLPLGAVGVRDELYEGLKGARIVGFTYGGHPVSSAAAAKVMEIYVRDKIVENVATVGSYALERLKTEFLPLPCVGDIQGLGLMLGIEIVADKATRAPFPMEQGVGMKIGQEARKKGLMIRAGNRLAVTPPLVITKEEIDKALDILLPIVAAVKPS
jgi:adenosylmethionine-8-amino-7-oxononanoate aminotransferase